MHTGCVIPMVTFVTLDCVVLVVYLLSTGAAWVVMRGVCSRLPGQMCWKTPPLFFIFRFSRRILCCRSMSPQKKYRNFGREITFPQPGIFTTIYSVLVMRTIWHKRLRKRTYFASGEENIINKLVIVVKYPVSSHFQRLLHT